MNLSSSTQISIPWLLLGVAYLAGIVTAGVALFRGRTPQGTVAWILALLLLPWLAVPAYWLFGRPFFHGYVRAQRRRGGVNARGRVRPSPLSQVTGLPESRGNLVQILKDGEATFASLFSGLARARESIAVQFYIIRDDALGRAFRDALLAAAARGVQVYLLMDWVGSQSLPWKFDRELRAGGVRVQRFRSSWGRIFRFQFKFRNHRKITVVDGVDGWVGGLNMGDEYRGQGRDGRPWRDTHAYLAGPAARDLQTIFTDDWFWATGAQPEGLAWSAFESASEEKGTGVTVVPSEPSDGIPVGSLLILDIIHSARKRLWITTAYFVPNATLVAALQLAALQGVDVRILVPARGDIAYMDWVSFAYFEGLLRAGVRIFRYTQGVLHAKTAIVDDHLGVIGTANLDPRSLDLNFEVTVLLRGEEVVRVLEKQMEADLVHALPITLEDLARRSLLDRFLTRIFYLFSPAL
jgi:cardiolipin synthase